jgi:hypothetical protein
MRSLYFATVIVTLSGVGAATMRANDQAVRPANIDLVLCLDVSSSMNGLINQARSKLWDIVNEFAKAEPTPHLRVALYSYGATRYDPQSGWVRRELEFTSDLDKVNEKLFALTTGGGTELVARVTRAALDELTWSTDARALKVIFVCGNESAHQDKQFTLKQVAEQAVEQGVIVNTIYCDPIKSKSLNNERIASGWRDLALLAEGRYAAINQDRTIATIATPQDKAIAELGAKLANTYALAGKDQKAQADNQKKQDANAAQQGGGASLGRIVTKANGLYRFANDLVESVQKDGKVDLSRIPEAELPERLKQIPAADREKHLKELAGQRTAIQNQILDLNRQRAAYIRQSQPTAPGGFDDALRGALQEQAKIKGIHLDKK